MTKAFGYLRVSGKDQIDGDGFPRQRAAIHAYAQQKQLRITRWFEEKAVCGDTEWEKRAAWSEMISCIDESTVIVVESFQRLARELFIQEYILRDLKKRNVELFSAQENDLAGGTDPTRVLIRQIMGAVSQYDRAMITLKLAGARKRMKLNTGRCEGQKPYGMKPGESEGLDFMRKLRADGKSFEMIALELQRSAFTNRKDKPWRATSICRILAREK